jgi:hypothetical protein
MSIICSNKIFSEGHRKRYDFVMNLKKYFKDKIDAYGSGINYIVDKWDGLITYKYHISIEYCSIRDYWTEKLTDAFLGYSYPFYYGCTNIYDYFLRDSLTEIDIEDFSGSVDIIEKNILEGRFESSLESLKMGRNLILTKYNLFAMIPEIIDSKNKRSKYKNIRLLPEASFTGNSRIKSIIKSFLNK